MLLAATGCGRLSFDAQSSGDASGDAVDAPCTYGPWSVPMLVPELSTDDEEFGGTLSRDGTTLIFPSDRPAGAGALDLYMATRPSTTEPFSLPVNLTGLNSAMNDAHPALSDDQLTLYFASTRSGLFQIYVATRASATGNFGAPSLLPLDVTGLGDVGSPEPSADELTLYFDASAGGPGGLDLWMTTRPTTTSPWSTPVQVPGVNTPFTEGEPTIDDGGLTLYYASSMYELPQDLVVSTRPDLASPFGPPTIVPLSLSAGVGEYGCDISADGRTMELSIHLGAPLKTNVFLSTRSCQ